MARAKICVWVLFLGLSLVMHGDGSGFAPAPTPASGMDCTNALIGLADCLSFVQEGSTVAKPQGGCCSGLKKVVKEQVSCLCDAFQESASFGVQLNMTRALSLPSACGVSTPAISNCKNVFPGVPVAAPAPSPLLGPSSSAGGGAEVPSPASGKSAAFILVSSLAHLVSIEFVLCFYFWL